MKYILVLLVSTLILSCQKEVTNDRKCWKVEKVTTYFPYIPTERDTLTQCGLTEQEVSQQSMSNTSFEVIYVNGNKYDKDVHYFVIK